MLPALLPLLYSTFVKPSAHNTARDEHSARLRALGAQRKRMKRIERLGDFRYLTFSTYHQLPLFQNDKLKDAFVAALDAMRSRCDIAIIAYVVMPEYVHVILFPRREEWMVSRSLHGLKRDFAKGVIARWRELKAPILARITDAMGRPRFWQPGGGYDRNVFPNGELVEKINYIHHNPVERGLVKRAIDWEWSSASWYATGEGMIGVDRWREVRVVRPERRRQERREE